MSWSGGTYTKGNNATGGWVGDASLGIGIEAGRHDTQDNDFATGINQCLNKDGSNSCTGNLNFGGFRPSNVAAGTAAAPAYCAGNDVNTGIFGPAADVIGFANNGGETVRITSTGDVGIGTGSTISGRLHISAATAVSAFLNLFANDTSGAQFNLLKSRGATLNTNTIVSSGDQIGLIRFQGANGTSYTEAARIAAEVDGTPGASNDMPGRLLFFTTPDGSGTVSERMRINSVGQVFVNTTSVRNTSWINNDFSGSVYSAYGTNDTTSTNGAVFHSFLTGGTLRGSITNNNNTAVAYNTTSDYRLKEAVQSMTGGLAKVAQLQPRTWKWKESGANGQGFIAHELQAVIPDAVTGVKDAVNEDGSPRYQGVDTSFLVATLTCAIQELNTKVQSLEAKIAELEENM